MNREAIAYHEAGHAVVAWRKRIAIRSVSIAREVESHGRVTFAKLGRVRPEAFDRWAERHIATALAGPLAQRRRMPASVRGWHGQGDFRFCTEMALRMQGSGELATAYLRWMEISTSALVDANWQHIERLAAALLDGQTIEGKDVVPILIGARAIAAV